jgi:peptidoglycan/xylan/chitin deacetylase (PgdA/CDA1 family)
VVILCYHSVHPSKWFASASPDLFAQHLEWLKEHCDVVPFKAIRPAQAGVGSDRPRVCITFDDGYADNFEYAFPALQKYGLTATFFTTVGLLEKDPAVIARFKSLRNTGYDDIRPMEWSQTREMVAAGLELGAHTYSHPNLAQIDESATRFELIEAKQRMEARLGSEVRSFAYPFGKPRRHFTSLATRLAAAANYDAAAAVLFRGVRPDDSRMVLPRFFVQQDSLELLSQKIAGFWDVIGWWQEYAPSWLNHVVSPADFERTKASTAIGTPQHL